MSDRPRRPRRPGLPALLWLVILGLGIAEFAIIAATADVPVPDQWGFRGYEAGMGIVFGLVAALIASRRPENRVGWLLLACSLIIAAQGVVTQWPVLAASDPTLPFLDLARWVRAWIWPIPNVGYVAVTLLLFPDGHLPGPRWRPALVLAGLATTVSVGTLIVASRPIGPVPPSTAMTDYVSAIGPIVLVGPILVAVASAVGGAGVFFRYRHADPVVRDQIKWVAWAGAVTVPGVALGLTPLPAGQLLLIASAFLAATAIGIAILRYRLYEIDVLINRTIVYAALSAVLAGVYSATITLSQKLFSAVTNESSDAALVLTTLVLVSLFTPLKTAIQSGVDRRWKPAPAADPGAPVGDPIELLGRLAPLHAAGVLSDDEYRAKKAELLARV